MVPSVRRVPAAEIDALVVRALREHLKPSEPIDDRDLVAAHVARVEVRSEQVVIQLAEAQETKPDCKKPRADRTIHLSWQKISARPEREILLPDGIPPQHARPIRSETRATLVKSISQGRRWLAELVADASATAESIARRENCSVSKVNMTISLAFLAPDQHKSSDMLIHFALPPFV